MSELQTLNIRGACGDKLFHQDIDDPNGPTFIICTAHSKQEGEVVDDNSPFVEAGESNETSVYEERLKFLGKYTLSYCGSCLLNPNPTQSGHFDNIGG